MIGRTLLRYEITAELGAGEFLRIWKHADPGTTELAEARAALALLERARQAAASGATTRR